MAETPLPTLCLAGPTASGKSAIALALAERIPLEIISVDSALVYCGLDIGTAKPSAAERAAVPHHLIDIRDPTEAYSAAEFARDATHLIAEIRARGRTPLLVGGTMLYFKALLDGLDELPPANACVRRQIDDQARDRGWAALHAELSVVDPVTAARLAPGDSQRIQRALEVWRLTGRPLSAFHIAKSGAGAARLASLNRLFSIEPIERAWLHRRIAGRFDAMLAAGLVHEVERLRARGDLTADLPAMRCVGYRQVWDTLEGRHGAGTLRERGIAATRQLAKRQLTWLRGMNSREVLPVGEMSTPAELAQRLFDGARSAAIEPPG